MKLKLFIAVNILMWIMFTTFSANAQQVTNITTLETLWWIQNPTVTDSIYTVDPHERDQYIACCGYINKGIAAVIPYSYNSYSAYPYSLPIYQLWGDVPATAHFYTTIVGAKDVVQNTWKWTYLGQSGRLFSNQYPNTLPVWRMRHGSGITSDMEYRYTLNTTEIQDLVSAGWLKVIIEGYAYPPAPLQNNIGIHTYAGYTYVLPPAYVTSNIFGTTASATCAGRLHVYVDGVYKGVIQDFQSGTLPGSITWGCYASIGPIAKGSTLKLYYSGAYADIVPWAGGTGYTKVLWPAAATFTINTY
jgi:hypothetical protein